jgi:hypothetical protein
MPMLRVAALAAVLAVPACVPPDDLASGAVVQANIADPQCPQDDCGNGNSPVINGVYFWMLSSFGLGNDQGVKIASVEKYDGTAMRLIADGDRLRGIHPVTNAALADHKALENTRITVSVGGLLYRIRIGYVTSSSTSPPADDHEHFWVGTRSAVEAYDFYYTPLSDPNRRETPLCTPLANDPENPGIRAIVFTGDNYDPVTKKITLGAVTNGWMNIACQKSAPYKMHLIGHTTAAQARLGIKTSLDKRQAMLNAWTMNACGTGTAFTIQGTPITLTESQFLLPAGSPYLMAPVSTEAIWGPDGAVCLDTPRVPSGTTLDDQLANIQDECGVLPSCSPMPATWTSAGSVLTGIPAAPAMVIVPH